MQVGIRLCADSSAAIGSWRQAGIGRERHLTTGELWVQERVRTGDVGLYKVPGAVNAADVLTKHLARDTCDRHLACLGLHRQAGRASSAPCA